MDFITYLTLTFGLVAFVVSINVATIFWLSYIRRRENKFMRQLSIYLMSPALAFFLVCGNLFVTDTLFHHQLSLLIIMVVSLYMILTGVKLAMMEWDETYCPDDKKKKI